MENIREYERKVNDKDRHDERSEPKSPPQPAYTPSGDTIVAKVPVYQHEGSVDKLYLKAGRFTDVVENEYDEYLKSTDPTISKNYHATKPLVKPHQSLLKPPRPQLITKTLRSPTFARSFPARCTLPSPRWHSSR